MFFRVSPCCDDTGTYSFHFCLMRHGTYNQRYVQILYLRVNHLFYVHVTLVEYLWWSIYFHDDYSCSLNGQDPFLVLLNQLFHALFTSLTVACLYTCGCISFWGALAPEDVVRAFSFHFISFPKSRIINSSPRSPPGRRPFSLRLFL